MTVTTATITPGSRIWFWSDTHFFHENLAKKWRTSTEQGFDGSVETHNEVLKNVWNSHIAPHDEVWIIGDAVMGPRVQGVEWFGKNLNGNKFLVPGNHDKCHPMFSKKSTYEADCAMYAEVFTIMDPVINGEEWFGDAGKGLIFCHFPWSHLPDHDEEGTRNVISQWGPSITDAGEHEATVLVHGHTHSSKPVGFRRVHVGVDAHPAPIQLHELIALAEISRITQETEG